MQAWAKYVNTHGGINGHKVKLIVKDDQGLPNVALTLVKAFAAQKNVLAVVGNVSSVVGTWIPIASALKLPVVGEFPFTPVSYTTKYDFPQGTTFPSILYGEVYSAIKTAGAKKIGLYYCAEESACAGSIPAVKAAASALGGSMVDSQAVPYTAPNYDSVCQAAKAAGVQSMVMALGVGTIISVAESCASIGYHPSFVVQTTALEPAEGTVASMNGHTYGVTETFPWVGSATTAQKQFQAGIKAAGVPAKDYGAALSLGWTGGALFQAAMSTLTNSPSRAALANALWHLPKGDTLGGLAPPLTFKANSPSPEQKCFFVEKLVGGTWKAPYGAKTFCQP
jgi:branched-chain amino acid transport system substrate-binding protein